MFLRQNFEGQRIFISEISISLFPLWWVFLVSKANFLRSINKYNFFVVEHAHRLYYYISGYIHKTNWSQCSLEFLLMRYAEWDWLIVKFLFVNNCQRNLVWFKLLECTPFHMYNFGAEIYHIIILSDWCRLITSYSNTSLNTD